MILSRFIMVNDISWTNFAWVSFWVIFGIASYTFAIMVSTTIRARQAFIKNELPKVHNNALQKERDKNKILKMEKQILIDEKEAIIIKNDELKVRLGRIKIHFDEGLKG